MRRSSDERLRSTYQEKLQELNLEDSPTGGAAKFLPAIYHVQYQGEKRELDRHIKGSNARDRRYGFRLYFFWDEENQVVIVGSLPEHLDNRAT